MTSPAVLARSNKRQRTVLRVGGVYDASFGVALLVAPAFLTGLMALPMPTIGAIWIRLDGIFLIVVGMIYWVMAQDPARYLGIMAMIFTAKAGSIIFYLTYVFAFGESKTFILFAVLDAMMFALHRWAIGPEWISRIMEALKPAQLDAA
jgi:hypothetical protein